MADELLSAKEAAQRLGIALASLYGWLGESDQGTLVIRGHPVTINYLQGGPQGQGRIKLPASEVERLMDLMRVRPRRVLPRRPSVRQEVFPGIVVKLGRPRQQLPAVLDMADASSKAEQGGLAEAERYRQRLSK